MVDASIVLGWSLAEEGDELSETSLAFVERHGAIAPTLFAYEIANVLAQLVRRGRLDAGRSDTIAAAIDALDIV